MGPHSWAAWRHLRLQIFPKLHQDTLSLCDLTKRMSRFLKLIMEVPAETALEVGEGGFAFFSLLF